MSGFLRLGCRSDAASPSVAAAIEWYWAFVILALVESELAGLSWNAGAMQGAGRMFTKVMDDGGSVYDDKGLPIDGKLRRRCYRRLS